MADTCEAPPGFLTAVTEAVGAAHCLSDPDLKASYETDWTRRFGGPALVVIRPGSTAEVAQVLAACNRFNVGVVPRAAIQALWEARCRGRVKPC